VGAELFHVKTDGRTESHTEANSRFSQLWKCTLKRFNEMSTSRSGTHTVAAEACPLLFDSQHNSFKL
jgi:hypothetical protein